MTLEQGSPQWAQNFNASTPPIPDFVGAGGELIAVGSGLESVSKVIQVVAFQVEESPFGVADAFAEGVLAEQGVNGIAVAFAFGGKKILLAGQFGLDFRHGIFLFMHFMLQQADSLSDGAIEVFAVFHDGRNHVFQVRNFLFLAGDHVIPGIIFLHEQFKNFPIHTALF